MIVLFLLAGGEAKQEAEAQPGAELPAATEDSGKEEKKEEKKEEEKKEEKKEEEKEEKKKKGEEEEKKDDEKENLDKDKEGDEKGNDDEKEDGAEGKDATDGEKKGGEEEEEKEVPKIPVDFYYKYEELMSKARVTEGSGLPNDLLTLQYPFHFDHMIIITGTWRTPSQLSPKELTKTTLHKRKQQPQQYSQ